MTIETSFILDARIASGIDSEGKGESHVEGGGGEGRVEQREEAEDVGWIECEGEGMESQC